MKILPVQSSLSRDFAILSGVILCVLLLSIVWVIHEAYEDYSERIISRLENESVRIDRGLIVEIKNASYLLESIGRQISQIKYFGVNKQGNDDNNARVRGDKNKEIARLLKTFDTENKDYDVFSWINKDQMLVASSKKGWLSKPIDISDRDYAKKAIIEPWQIQIGRPVLSRVSGRWTIPISMGVTDMKGNYIGQVLLNIAIDNLIDKIHQQVQDPSISFAIYSKTLTMLAAVKGKSDKEESAENTHDEMKIFPINALEDIDLDKNKSGILSKATLFNRDKNYVIYEVSSKYPYVTLLSYDVSFTQSEFVKFIVPRLLEIIAVSSFLIFVLFIIKTRVTRPVEELGRIAENIIQGKGYYPLKERAPKEIENLATNIEKFDKLIKEKDKIAQELIAKNAYLQRIKDNSQLINKVRMQFLLSIADELSKPTAEIISLSEAFRDKKFGVIRNEKYLKQAADIYMNSRILEQMIEDVISVAKLEKGVLSTHEKPVNTSFVIHKTVRDFLEQPQYSHIDIKLRKDENLALLMIDDKQLSQVLLNMLTMIAKQMEDGSSIVIECSVEKNTLGKKEYIFMLKYVIDINNTPKLDMSDRETTQKTINSAQPTINSEGISFALTRMLVSLYDGEVRTKISSNNVCRIYITFSENRICERQ